MTHHSNLVQTFYCDGIHDSGHRECPNSYEDIGTAKEIWKQAVDDGWWSEDGKHFCPNHKKNTSRREETPARG